MKMAKLIKAYKDNFTIVDNDIFKDQRLSYKELGLLCQMLSLPNNWNCTVAGLAAIHKDGIDSIKSGIKKLEQLGYLTRKRSRDDAGLYTGNDYLIYQNPKDNPDFNPSVENPPVDNPSVENPLMENPAEEKPLADNQEQYSTKELKNNLSNTYESDSGTDGHVYSEEEIMGWDVEEFYANLNDREYEAFVNMYKASMKGEIHSSRESLMEYFKKMKVKGWKDSSGKPIRNIEGYIRSNFTLYSENERKKREDDQIQYIE